jgi:hypothetical protein
MIISRFMIDCAVRLIPGAYGHRKTVQSLLPQHAIGKMEPLLPNYSVTDNRR